MPILLNERRKLKFFLTIIIYKLDVIWRKKIFIHLSQAVWITWQIRILSFLFCKIKIRFFRYTWIRHFTATSSFDIGVFIMQIRIIVPLLYKLDKNFVTFLIGKKGKLKEFFISIFIKIFEFLRRLFCLCQLQLMRKHSNDGGNHHMTQLWFIQEH